MCGKIVKDDNFVIGIVGGMGSYATVDFFRRLVDAFPAEKEWERPRIIIDNYCTMPSRVRALLYDERRDELVAQLSSAVAGMMAAGVNKIVFACNTSHAFVPEVVERVPECEECIVNIIEECAGAVEAAGETEVGLVATEGTIDSGIYHGVFEKRGIRVNAPGEEEFGRLRSFIEAVKQSKIDDEVCEEFVRFVDDFSSRAVILGCTEIPILYSECVKRGLSSNKRIIDPLQAAIDAIVEAERSFSK